MGNCGCFWFFCLTVCFTPSLFCPPFSIHHATTLHHHALTHPTPHTHPTMAHTTRHATTRVCCGVCCLRVAVFVCRCLPALSSLNPNHVTPSNHPIRHILSPPMHEPMSEWEGAVVCVWTPQPKHQPPQPSHDATHTTCSLSFHPLAIHTLHNTTTPTVMSCDRTCPTQTHIYRPSNNTQALIHTGLSLTHEGRVQATDINHC